MERLYITYHLYVIKGSIVKRPVAKQQKRCKHSQHSKHSQTSITHDYAAFSTPLIYFLQGFTYLAYIGPKQDQDLNHIQDLHDLQDLTICLQLCVALSL